jgi:hypothetical protein
MNRFRFCCGLAVYAALSITRASCEEPKPAKAAEPVDPLVAGIEQGVQRYELRTTTDGKLLTPTTVLRWKNNSRGQEAIALMVIWTHGGRPVAQASIYPWQGKRVHEFGSLCAAKEIEALADGDAIWSPQTDGVAFQILEDAPEPADTPAARLRQMKQIAGRFEAVMTGWRVDRSDRETLRLLAKELHRYDAAALKASQSNILDGAMFGFVQGTDPEVTMLLQAENVDGKLRWKYAFTRATSGGLEVKLRDKIVWSAERNYQQRDPEAANFNQHEFIDLPPPVPAP